MRPPILQILLKSAAREVVEKVTPHTKEVAIRALSTDVPRTVLGQLGLVRLADVVEAVRDIDKVQSDHLERGQCTAWGVITLLNRQYGLK